MSKKADDSRHRGTPREPHYKSLYPPKWADLDPSDPLAQLGTIQELPVAHGVRRSLNHYLQKCMSDDVKTARSALVGYLHQVSHGLFILGCADEADPLHRLISALEDLQIGAQPALFAVDRPASRPPKEYIFQDTLGAACAAISALVRDGEERTKADAAKAVAKRLKELGLPLPDEGRATGKSDKPRADWRRLLDFHYKIQRGEKHEVACFWYKFYRERSTPARTIIQCLEELSDEQQRIRPR